MQLTYKAIREHFQGQAKTDFENSGRVGEFQERVAREEAYIEGRSSYIPLPDLAGGGKRTKDEDELDIPRKLCAVFPGAREGILSRTDVLHRVGSFAALRAFGYKSGIGIDG